MAFSVFIIASVMSPNLAWLFLLALIAVLFIFYMTHSKLNDRLESYQKTNTQTKLNEALPTPYHPLAEALQFPVYIIDDQGKVAYANSKSVETFGSVGTGELISIRFRQPELRNFIDKALNSRKAMTREYNEPIPNNRWFGIEISPISNITNTNENSLFLLGFHDLTEEKRTDQMRSDFIANASHELRTPLASLLGYIETIKGPARNDAKAIDRFTDVMLNQAQRMTRLVNDLLSLSRIEMQSHVKPSQVVDLDEIISSVIASLGSVASQLNVKIKVEKCKGLQILGDRDELMQVFENLIENACKYGQEGEEVIVSSDTDSDPGNVIVSIQDFGPGIAIEHQHRITERFYRVDVERSREKQGTGLGLAIVKHILNRHGTKLNVESTLNEGTRFFVKFPLMKPVK